MGRISRIFAVGTAAAAAVFNAALAGGARFAPPSHSQALAAVQARITGEAEESYFFDATVDPERRRSFPLDVQLLKCSWNGDRRVPRPSFGVVARQGYDCVVEIFPAAQPNFRVYGFFYHTGLDWAYYGALGEAFVVQVDRYDTGLIKSRQTAREGSELYRGQPLGPVLLKDPYEDILDAYLPPPLGFERGPGVRR